MNEAYSIKEAAIELGINYSTAKHIVRVFKEQGTIKTKAQVKEEKRNETKLAALRNTPELQLAQSRNSCVDDYARLLPNPFVLTSKERQFHEDELTGMR